MLNLKEMATKMKNNIVDGFPCDYDISDALQHGFSKDVIRSGIKGFAPLLSQIFDVIIENADKSGSEEVATVNSIGITNIYTGIKNPLTLLYCIGVCGKFNDNSRCLLVDGIKLDELYRKTRSNKPLENMRLLQDAGLAFSVDLSAKSLNLKKAGTIEIHYPDDAKALIGLKVLSAAVSQINRDIHFGDVINTFSRCDYRVVSNPKKYAYEIRAVSKFLPEDDSKFLIHLHDFLIASKCKYESKVNMGAYQFTYTKKGTTANLLSIKISLDRNYVRINSKLIKEQPDILLSKAPKSIYDAVINGFTCLKKENPDACNPKCAGKNLSFVLGGTEYLKCWIINFILPVNNDEEREFVKIWLEKELAG